MAHTVLTIASLALYIYIHIYGPKSILLKIVDIMCGPTINHILNIITTLVSNVIATLVSNDTKINSWFKMFDTITPLIDRSILDGYFYPLVF